MYPRARNMKRKEKNQMVRNVNLDGSDSDKKTTSHLLTKNQWLFKKYLHNLYVIDNKIVINQRLLV